MHLSKTVFTAFSSTLIIAMLTAQPAVADQAGVVALTANLSENSHVCNSESEIARLSENEQLQQMARALVEFKATKYCFILPPAATVTLLERHPAYIKFSYQSQTLYTFNKYVLQ